MTDLIDLSESSGLPIFLDQHTGRLTAAESVQLGEAGGRTIGDLRDVLAIPGGVEETKTIYLTYRDVRFSDDAWLAQNELRYDITITLPGDINGEFNKTAGHYHSLAPGGTGYPEIYDVLYGKAAFILQLSDNPLTPNPVVTRAEIVFCTAGQRLVIPPNYGHVTVNYGDTPLVVADLVAASSENIYESYRLNHGAVRHIFRTVDTNEPKVRLNRSYSISVPTTIRSGTHSHPAFGDSFPLYAVSRESPELVAFLTNPLALSDALDRIFERN